MAHNLTRMIASGSASHSTPTETPETELPDGDYTPPTGGAGATRPIAFTATDANEANDNSLFAANDNEDIRAGIEERLPLLPRFLVDWFTGKPILDGRSVKNRLGPVSYMAVDMGLALAAATVGAAAMVAATPLSPVIVIWMLLILTGRLRKIQTLIGHEASHRNFFRSGDARRDKTAHFALGMDLNDFLGELATTFALSMSVDDYRRDHDLHHAAATYTTESDPDAIYFRSLRHGFWGLLNPADYARDFIARLRSNLFSKRWGKRLMSWGWVCALLGSIQFMSPLSWMVMIFLPWVVLFRVSAILQIASLHSWNLPAVTSHQEYADRTWGRFSGIAVPLRGLTCFAWIKAWFLWWTEICFLELPFRIAVLSPDLQNHDVHHLEWILAKEMRALGRFVDDWINQPYRRAEVIRDSGDPLQMGRREVWGVRAMWKIARENFGRIRDVPGSTNGAQHL